MAKIDSTLGLQSNQTMRMMLASRLSSLPMVCWLRSMQNLRNLLAANHPYSKVSVSLFPLVSVDTFALVEWLRVVLDEAHSCKSRSSKTAKAAYALQARRRWAVTGSCQYKSLLVGTEDIFLGTPIVNKLEDLYSLLYLILFISRICVRSLTSHRKFLDFKPWSDFAFFRS